MKKIKDIKVWFSSQKLKQKVRYLFLIIISAYVILFFFIYSFFIRKNMIHYTLKSNADSLVSIGNNLNREFNNINSMSLLIMANSNINEYLKNDDVKKDARYEKSARMALYDFYHMFDYVDSVFIFREDGEYFSVENGITSVDLKVMNDKSFYQPLEERAGGYLVTMNGAGAFSRQSGDDLVSFMRVINDIHTQKPVGTLIINLRTDILLDTYNNLQGDGKKFTYYEAKNLEGGKALITEITPYYNASTSIYQKVGGTWGKDKVLSYYKIPDSGFTIIGSERINFLQVVSGESAWIIVALLLVTGTSLIAIGLFISRSITTPIEKLVKSMGSAKQGWLKRVSLSLPDDEIGHLKDSYNEMLVAINHLITELLEQEKSMQKAELDVLQEQIKPHFLYNTLETIAYFALEKPPLEVYEAVETLGAFYRRFLSSGQKEITLQEEVEIVKSYLKLQKMRYEDIFEDEYELEEGLEHVIVPKLILQPLVENSLYHGVRLKGEKGVIKITITRMNEYISVKVYDSGIGMSKKMIDDLMTSNNEKSFGLKRTIERIQYFYHSENIYEIRSQEGLYTEVELKLPY